MKEKGGEFNFNVFLEELGNVAPGHRLDQKENTVNPELKIPEINDKLVTIISAVANRKIGGPEDKNGQIKINDSIKRLVELYPDKKEYVRQMVSDRSAEDLKIQPNDLYIFGEQK